MPPLRCWPGALAVLRDSRCSGHNRLVEVKDAIGMLGLDLTLEPGFFWRVLPQGWAPMQGECEPEPDGCFYWPDHLLTPITPPPGLGLHAMTERGTAAWLQQRTGLEPQET